MSVARPLIDSLIKNHYLISPVKIKMVQPFPIKEDALLQEDTKEAEYKLDFVNDENKGLVRLAIVAFLQSIYLYLSIEKVPFYLKAVDAFLHLFDIKGLSPAPLHPCSYICKYEMHPPSCVIKENQN